jgi:hypothetical protein
MGTTPRWAKPFFEGHFFVKYGVAEMNPPCLCGIFF